MTDAAVAAPQPPTPTAGALLRLAREAQGLHIAALAASLKVPPRKLEALEQDRYEELPDPAFTRALAQSICRTLKIDAAPVLALLPRAGGGRLDHVAVGLNTPFRERPGAAAPAMGSLLARPVVWLVALLLLGALAVYFWPEPSSTVPAVEPAASAGEGGVGLAPAGPEPQVVTLHSAPAVETNRAAAEAAATPANAGGLAATDATDATGAAAVTGAAAADVPGLLAVRTTEASWVEVTDAGRRTLLSRTVQPGETVGLDGALPLRLTIGNASATQLTFRGQAVELAPHVRDNIARLELQ